MNIVRSEFGDRIRGAMLGAAVGDALGAPFEYTPSAAIEQLVGSPRVDRYLPAYPWLPKQNTQPGTPTDDTAFAISLARVLSKPGVASPATIAEAWVRDLGRDGDLRKFLWKGALGGATTRALWRLGNGADAATNGYPEDGGNGAVRCAWVAGLLPSRAQAADVATIQARITHGHPAAIDAAKAFALSVHGSLRGQIVAGLPDGEWNPRLVESWEKAHLSLKQQKRLPLQLRDVLMTAWDTAAAAHAIAFLYQADFESGVSVAAGSGACTDTIASMAGALLGALHGARSIPKRWKLGLKYRSFVDSYADDLITRYYSAEAPAV